jgi:hypothetical protein
MLLMFCKKLECFNLASFSSLAQGLQVRCFKPSLHWQSLVQYRTQLCLQYRTIYTYLGHHVAQGVQGK